MEDTIQKKELRFPEDCYPEYPPDSLQDRLHRHILDNIEEKKSMNAKMDQIIKAFDIDEQGNSQLKTKVEEMHTVFSSAHWAGKTVLKIFVVIGTISGATVGVIELIKRFK